LSVDILFDNGYIKNTTWEIFNNKKWFLSPYCKTVCGVGFMGEGIYSHSHKSKDTWMQMIHRIHSDKKKRGIYEDVEICNEWYNFQNFAKWYDDNYYELDECMSLDKDIIDKKARRYSPETCLLVPLVINDVFVLQKSRRGDYPIGVTLRKDTDKLRVHFTKSFFGGKKIPRKRFSYGQYTDINEAFHIYKQEKEKYIREVAEYYKSRVSEKVYNAMLLYRVEIDD
jgi:hypothetical protein